MKTITLFVIFQKLLQSFFLRQKHDFVKTLKNPATISLPK